MKKFNSIFSLITLLLSSCSYDSFFVTDSTTNIPNNENDNGNNNDKPKEDDNTDHVHYFVAASGDNSQEKCSICNLERYMDISIYSTNDYHGAVKDSDYMPLEYLGSYLKERSSEKNTLLIDCGDTWQGSLESNYNYGNMITDVFNAAKVDARVVGNHDFDWGIEKLISNNARSYNNYKMTSLAANVYDYDFDKKEMGSIQQDEIGKEYYITTLENGLKVGVVGIIGKDQITSISTNLVQNIGFTNHITKLKEISDVLRIDKKCDVVIAACHTGKENLLNYGLSSISSKSQKKYFDLVLCGHTHKNEKAIENNVYFTQTGGNGNQINKATLVYDNKINGLVYSKSSNTTINYYNVTDGEVDLEIQNIVDSYSSETSTLGSLVVAKKVSGYFSSTVQLPNLMCEAIANAASKQGYDIDFACCNQARTSLSNSSYTYSDIYEAFPFDNYVYVIEVSGYDILNQLYASNNFYRVDTSPLNTSKHIKLHVSIILLSILIAKENMIIMMLSLMTVILKRIINLIYIEI